MWEGAEKSKPPGPHFEEEVVAALCLLTVAEQGVVMSPCWSVEQSLMLHGPYPWCHVGQRNGDPMRNVRGECQMSPGFGNRGRDPGPLTPTPGSPYMVSRAPPTHWLWWDWLGTRIGVVMRWEKDHVIVGAERHELQTPKHHDGAEVKWVKSV